MSTTAIMKKEEGKLNTRWRSLWSFDLLGKSWKLSLPFRYLLQKWKAVILNIFFKVPPDLNINQVQLCLHWVGYRRHLRTVDGVDAVKPNNIINIFHFSRHCFAVQVLHLPRGLRGNCCVANHRASSRGDSCSLLSSFKILVSFRRLLSPVTRDKEPGQ